MAKKHSTTALPVEKVEAMFDAYVKNPNIGEVAKLCGISYGTCRKYVKNGDRRRGIEPFEQRVRRLTKLTARRVEKRIAYHRADATAAAWQQLQIFDDIIIEAMLRYREILQEVKPKLSEIAKAAELSLRMKQNLREWSEESGEDTPLEESFEEFSIEQLEEFASTGRLPQHRVAPGGGGRAAVPNDAAGELLDLEADEAEGEGDDELDPVPGWLEPEE